MRRLFCTAAAEYNWRDSIPPDDRYYDEGDDDDYGTAAGNNVPTPVSLTTTTRTVFQDPDNDEENDNNKLRTPVCPRWTAFTEGFLLHGLRRMVVTLSMHAATHPITYLVVISILSLATLVVGFLTNFELIVDSDKIFTPINSLPTQHYDWLVEESGFSKVRPIMMVIHANGDNVLEVEPVQKLFDAIDVVRNTPGYDDICKQGTFLNFDGVNTCRIMSATRFWDHNATLFQQEIANHTSSITHATGGRESYEMLVDIMSQDTYRDGMTPVFHEAILGNYERNGQTTTYSASTNLVTVQNHTPRLQFVQSYVVRMEIPDIPTSDEFETQALKNLERLKGQWEMEDISTSSFRRRVTLDFLSIFAYKIENQRAMIKDLPLVGGIFLVLVIFTTLVYHKKHKVQSRSMIGIASLTTIGLSLFFSYGIVWICGVPFTNLAQILPFMIMGVGLDDTFIITGSYFRTNPDDHPVKRIKQTMEEVGLSITLTTTTTMLAFVLGCFSAIPGVRWLCIYAFAAIFCDYFFQITIFVAFLVLDERRVQANRNNCCVWRIVPDSYDDNEDDYPDDEYDKVFRVTDESVGNDASGGKKGKSQPTKHFSERFMAWYADQLMRPIVKFLVLVTFASFFALCLYRATLLKQIFNVEDYVPSDSYLRGTLEALENHYSLVKPIEVYFRGEDLDQSDPAVQQQMREYIGALSALPQIQEEPPFCWVRDFPKIEEQFPQYAFIKNFTFNQQLDIALANPTIREVYGQDIIRDASGNVTASRCLLFLRNVDLSSVREQMDMLHGQREVTQSQELNQDRSDWAFFTFDNIYFYWEMYSQAVPELLSTLVTGVAAVTATALLLMPHWTAAFIVFPNIIVLYINFLGTMQLMGLHINSLTYIIIVMSIGLLVDFLMHILLRYYETYATTREEKVKETMRSMGASMLIGGLTTFLGVCPLALSTTHIFMTVFWSFLAIVVLGCAHGLILLPVILSLIGPTATCLHEQPTFETTQEQTDSSSSDEEEARVAIYFENRTNTMSPNEHFSGVFPSPSIIVNEALKDLEQQERDLQETSKEDFNKSLELLEQAKLDQEQVKRENNATGVEDTQSEDTRLPVPWDETSQIQSRAQRTVEITCGYEQEQSTEERKPHGELRIHQIIDTNDKTERVEDAAHYDDTSIVPAPSDEMTAVMSGELGQTGVYCGVDFGEFPCGGNTLNCHRLAEF